MMDKIDRLHRGQNVAKNDNASKVANEIVSRVKAFEARFPLLPYIEERNFRWGANDKFFKVIADYFNA
jgi:Golgi nucleoside diphosphatase